MVTGHHSPHTVRQLSSTKHHEPVLMTLSCDAEYVSVWQVAARCGNGASFARHCAATGVQQAP